MNAHGIGGVVNRHRKPRREQMGERLRALAVRALDNAAVVRELVTRYAFRLFALACLGIAAISASLVYDETQFGMAVIELATGIFLIAAGAALWKGSDV